MAISTLSTNPVDKSTRTSIPTSATRTTARGSAMSKEAMKLALEALKYMDGYYISLPQQGMQAIKALEAALEARKALAKQEQGEPVAITITGKLGNIYSFTGDYSLKKGDKVYTTPQPKQEQGEPVAYMSPNRENFVAADDVGNSVPNWTDYYPIPLYTKPQQRTLPQAERAAWVGLTDEEANELWESTDSDWELMKRVEAKLKEKNNA